MDSKSASTKGNSAQGVRSSVAPSSAQIGAPYSARKFAYRMVVAVLIVVFVWLRLMPWWMVASVVTLDSITYCLREWLAWEKAR